MKENFYIPSFSYCRKIKVQANGKEKFVDVSTPYTALTPVAVPGNFSFVVAFTLGGLFAGKDYNFNILFVDPNGKAITESTLTVAPLKKNFSNYAIQASVDFVNAVLPVEGIYKTVVKFGSDILGEFSILVQARGTGK